MDECVQQQGQQDQEVSFETETGSEDVDGSDPNGQRELDEEASRQIIYQQRQLIRRLTDENRLLRQAELENEEYSSDLRLRIGSAEKRVVEFESLRRLRVSMEDDNDALRASLAQEKSRSVALEARVSSLEHEKSGLLTRLGAAEDEEHTLRQKLESVQDDYNSALQLCTGKEDGFLVGIQEQLAQSAARTGLLEQRLGEVLNTCNDLRAEKSQLESEVIDLRNHDEHRRTPDHGESILKPQPLISEQLYSTPVTQSTPLREGGQDLRRELRQCLADCKSPTLNLENFRQTPMHNGVECVSPTPSDASALDLRSFNNASDLLDVVASFREHFEEKKNLALQHVADLSQLPITDTESDYCDASPINAETLATFEGKLRRLVASRAQAARKAVSARHSLKDARAELATALEQREKSDRTLADASAECEALRQQLERAEASRDRMVAELQQMRKMSSGRSPRGSRSSMGSPSSSMTDLRESSSSSHDQPVAPEQLGPSPSPSPSGQSPNKAARRRLRQWSGDAADGDDDTDSGRFVPLRTSADSIAIVQKPAKFSCLRTIGRCLLYLLLLSVLVMCTVVFVCPALRSNTECCACPPQWARDLLGKYLVAAPVEPSPL